MPIPTDPAAAYICGITAAAELVRSFDQTLEQGADQDPEGFHQPTVRRLAVALDALAVTARLRFGSTQADAQGGT